MSISLDEVRHVATLSRIEMDEAEVEKFGAQLADIVAYIDKLTELDTAGVEPLTNASGLTSVLRCDTLQPSLDRDAALANSPAQSQGHYRVPRIIE